MTLGEARVVVAGYLEKIAKVFVPEMKLTVIARLPGYDESDFLMTDDALDEVAKVIQRMKVREARSGGRE